MGLFDKLAQIGNFPKRLFVMMNVIIGRFGKVPIKE